MKQILGLLILLSFSSNSFSQTNNQNEFSHTIAHDFGIIIPFMLDSYEPKPSFDGSAYSALNFIPSYELGYRNMFFGKVKYRNLRNREIYFDDISEEKEYLDAYSIIFSYNTLWMKDKLALKVGAGYSIFNVHTVKSGFDNNSQVNYKEHIQDIKYANFVFSVSLTKKLSKNFVVGLDIDLYDLIICRDYSLSLGYTF